MTKRAKQDLAFINEHREATGYPKFTKLSRAATRRHLALIDEHAPRGNDPWSVESKGGVRKTQPSVWLVVQDNEITDEDDTTIHVFTTKRLALLAVKHINKRGAEFGVTARLEQQQYVTSDWADWKAGAEDYFEVLNGEG